MTDNTTLPGTGEVVEDIDIGSGVKRQVVALGDRAGTTNDPLGGVSDAAWSSGNGGVIALLKAIASFAVAPTVKQAAVTITESVTRPANTTAYAIGDAWSSSTSAPADIVFTGATSGDGKTSRLVDIVIIDEANQSTPLVGELWLFDSPVTKINDNSPFTLSNSEMEKLVGIVPFTLGDTGSSASGASGNCAVSIPVNINVTTVGSGNLYGLIKDGNAYTPVSAEKLVFRAKFEQLN
jgi:hypothetical protein